MAQVGRAEVRTSDGRQIVGLLRPGLGVSEGLKAGDLDHRGDGEICFTISEKAQAPEETDALGTTLRRFSS